MKKLRVNLIIQHSLSVIKLFFRFPIFENHANLLCNVQNYVLAFDGIENSHEIPFDLSF